MADTHIEINGKCVGEYDICDKPCVKFVNGSGPDDCGNVKVDGGGPTINGGYDTVELVTLTDETVTSGELMTGGEEVCLFMLNNVGSTMIITFDGTQYECSITGGGGYWGAGDDKFIEYPFYIGSRVNTDRIPIHETLLYTSTSGKSHAIKIEAYKSTPVVFDRKYIPDMPSLTESNRYSAISRTWVYTIQANGAVNWVACDDYTDIAAPLRFTKTYDGNYRVDTDRSIDGIIGSVDSGHRVIATCVVRGEYDPDIASHEVYISTKTKGYKNSSEATRGVLFTFVSLYDSSDKFELFLKMDGTVVEGDPNTTTES